MSAQSLSRTPLLDYLGKTYLSPVPSSTPTSLPSSQLSLLYKVHRPPKSGPMREMSAGRKSRTANELQRVEAWLSYHSHSTGDFGFGMRLQRYTAPGWPAPGTHLQGSGVEFVSRAAREGVALAGDGVQPGGGVFAGGAGAGARGGV